MSNLSTIVLGGALGRQFGKEFRLDVRSPAEAVAALCVLRPGFEKALTDSRSKGVDFAVYVDENSISEFELALPASGKKIRISPVIQGRSRGIFQVIAGVALITAVALSGPGGWAATAIGSTTLGGIATSIGIGLAFGGIAQMLAPSQKGIANVDSSSAQSYVFSGAVNTTAVGLPVPVLIGRMRVGSRVISASIKTQNQTDGDSQLLSSAVAGFLDLVSEGPIKGLVNGAKSIYLNDTPLQNPDGSYNFDDVSFDTRLGTNGQEYMPSFSTVENEIGIGVELRSDSDFVRAINQTQLTSLRVRLSVPQLQKVDTSSGKIEPYTIQYAIDLSTDGGAYQTVRTNAFSGTTTTEYQRDEAFDLPAATEGWQIRVRRLTANANSTYIADTVNIEAIVEVIDAKMIYPNSALIGSYYSAKSFSGSAPTRSFDCEGVEMLVPSNYDPVGRVYVGDWDGTFKTAYTNNPAWAFYLLALNKRFGAGRYVNLASVNKWVLYQIAQYCDELVDDGLGGQEPRFTCNIYLQSTADAFKVLQDIASIFRGMSYWGNGNVNVSSDMPVNDADIRPFTAANVLGGKFTRQGAALRTRYTVALVTWNDPSDGYKQKVEYVEDQDGIDRYGYRETSITAIGGTSQSEAQRRGRWTLLTSRYETQAINFSVGLDSAFIRPGSVIRVADPALAGRRIGGRIAKALGNKVWLDKAPEVVNVGDTLYLSLPSGAVGTQAVTGVSGRVVTVGANWAEDPLPEAVWAYESADLKTQLYRVLSIAAKDGLEWEVNATQHEPQKYAYIDSGTKIESRPITAIPPSIQAPPTNVSLTTYDVIDQGIYETVMVISWAGSANAIDYVVEWSRDGGAYISAGSPGTQQIEVQGIYAGAYVARVKARNAIGVESIWAYSVETDLTGSTAKPPSVTNLTATSIVFGIQLDWGFPEGPNTVQRTEIWYSETDDRTAAIKLGDFAYPQNTHTMMGLAAGATFYFWARLVDKIGNVGDWVPLDAGAGVLGEASSSASLILQYLIGEITDSQLGEALLAKINAGAGASISVDQVVTALAAMYTIKTQFVSATGRTYVAGIGVGVENDDGIIESQVLVAASRFAVLDPNGTAVALPFVIQGGQVFMNEAFIQDASIGSAKIAEQIQSDNYVAGTDGWAINKAGTAEFNNITARGDITANRVIAHSIVTDSIVDNAVTTMATWSGVGTFTYGASGGDVLVIVSVNVGGSLGSDDGGGSMNFIVDSDIFTVGGLAGTTNTAIKRYSGWTGSKTINVSAPSGGAPNVDEVSVTVFEAKK